MSRKHHKEETHAVAARMSKLLRQHEIGIEHGSLETQAVALTATSARLLFSGLIVISFKVLEVEFLLDNSVQYKTYFHSLENPWNNASNITIHESKLRIS